MKRSGWGFGRPLDRLLVGVGVLVVLFMAGCAARPPQRPRTIPPGAPPASASTDSSGRALPPSEPSAIPKLPGADRVFPSEEEKNKAAAGAPEAFPLPEKNGPGVDENSEDRASGEEDRLPPLTPDEASKEGKGGAAAESGRYALQLLASSSEELTRRRAQEIQKYFAVAVRVDGEGGLFKVRLGPFASREEAEKWRKRAATMGYRDAFVADLAGSRNR